MEGGVGGGKERGVEGPRDEGGVEGECKGFGGVCTLPSNIIIITL